MKSVFLKNISAEIQLLNDGKPLEAIDSFYSDDIIMYDNDQVFADGFTESRSKQEPFIKAAKSISGNIVDLVIDEVNEVAIFLNKSQFINSAGKVFQINGLCWQQWKEGKVSEERYYTGELMKTKLVEFYN